MKTATKLINALSFAEVNGSLSGDTRRMMQDERIALSAAVKTGDPKQIGEAMIEANRVAEMWGVSL